MSPPEVPKRNEKTNNPVDEQVEVLKELKVHRVREGQQVLLDQQVLRDYKVHKVLQARQEQQVLPVLLVLMA